MNISKVLYLVVGIFLTSCFKQFPDDLDSQSLQSCLTKSTTDEYIIVDHSRVASDILASAHRIFPEKKIINLRSVIESGQTVLYIANFDTGWAILAADDRASQEVFAYGESGVFDLNNANPEVTFWFEMIKEEQAKIVNEKDTIRVDGSAIQRSQSYEPYYWLGFPIGIEYSNNYSEVDHLLNTKWTQGYPWSQKCVYYGEGISVGYFLTGCLAVSTAQILYYLKTTKNFSIGLYDNVNPTFSSIGGGKYIISELQRTGFNLNSSKWAQMPLTSVGPNTLYVSDLMIDIGYQFGLTYSLTGTGTLFIAPVFQDYNVLCSNGAFYYSLVKDSLDNGYPIMVVAYETPSYLNSHAWVIDGYKQAQAVTDRQYRWYIAPSDSLSYYSGYEFCYTEAQKQLYAPDANEYEVYHIYEITGGNFLRMNWGWGDDSDNGYYHMSDYHWPAGNDNQFKYHPLISYDFYQEEDEQTH